MKRICIAFASELGESSALKSAAEASLHKVLKASRRQLEKGSELFLSAPKYEPARKKSLKEALQEFLKTPCLGATSFSTCPHSLHFA